jgi:hypothetical protein
MQKFLLLAVVGLLFVGCDGRQTSRYQLVAGGGTVGNLVFRLDQDSGEVCAFRWWPSQEPRYQGDKGQIEGFSQVGCAK